MMFPRAGDLRRAVLDLLPGAIAGLFLLLPPAVEASAAGEHPRLCILGFDGLDYAHTAALIARGDLPNLAALAEGGAFLPLATTAPPESPSAWTSFITGMNPGKHGIYDFVGRNAESYLPGEIGVMVEDPRFLWGLFPLHGPRVASTRSGETVWSLVDERGVRVAALFAPMTYPAPELEHGRIVSGLGAPDLKGTNGTFHYLATDLPAGQEGDARLGGVLRRLEFENGHCVVTLEGPPDVTDEERKPLSTPLELTLRQGGAVEIALGGEQATLHVGDWSPYLPVEFAYTPLCKVRGVCRLRLLESAAAVRLYVSPITIDPRGKPWFPVAYPESFLEELTAAAGPWKVLGWPTDTWALTEERIGEDVYLEDVAHTLAERERISYQALESLEWDFFFTMFYAPDEVQHMFWRCIDPASPRFDEDLAARFGNAIDDAYRTADRIVGEVLKRLPEDATLLILSDHGFGPFRRGVNLNTWLARAGLLTLQTTRTGAIPIKELVAEGNAWPHVDWSRTRAYAMGMGQVFVNLRGREGQGIVLPGREYEAVRDRIVDGLSRLVDPETGAPAVARIWRREEIYRGQRTPDAPDLLVSFPSGYRVSWQTTLGGAPPMVLEDNPRLWSGDHAAALPDDVPGVLFASRPLARDEAAIVDLAPTVLSWFGIPIPEIMDGSPLLEEAR